MMDRITASGVSRENQCASAPDFSQLFKAGALTVLASIAAVQAIRAVAVAILHPDAEFAPLQVVPPIIDTVVGAGGAAFVFGQIGEYYLEPIRTYRRVAAGVLIVSFVPDIAFCHEAPSRLHLARGLCAHGDARCRLGHLYHLAAAPSDNEEFLIYESLPHQTPSHTLEDDSLEDLTCIEAVKILEAARTASEEASIATSIAVVDAGGHLLAFLRLDGAVLATVEVCQVKARTALFFGTASKNLPFDKPFTPALLGAVSYPLAFVPGGVPIRRNGRLIGAIGVGGGSGDQDHSIASMAVDVLVSNS